MNKSKHIRLLRCGADEEAFKPIEEQLIRRGFRVDEGAAGKDDVVLAVLSKSFFEDEDLTKKLLGLIGSGADKVLPLQLDEAPIPEQLKNALYARNIIPAAGRDASLIADRIVSALPRKKSRLPLVLAAAGLALIALVGLLIWRSAAGEKLPAMAGEGPIVIPAALGITEEDLASIENVVIVADQIAFFKNYEIKGFVTNGDVIFMPEDAFQSWDHFAYLDEWNDVHWYSKETGQELSSERWDDLRFIGLMPNLRSLTMVLVDTEESALPDLRGAEKLERVDIESCGFESIDWIAGSSAQELTLRFTPVHAFGALTSCEGLRRVSIDMFEIPDGADFSGFAPPRLEDLWLWHANSGSALDLSSLRGCGELFDVTLGDLPLKDLSCLEKAEKLSMLRLSDMNGLTSLKGIEGLPVSWLEITNCSSLREIRAVGELKGLCSLYIESCGKLRDFSPAAGCSQLEQFHVWGMHGQVRDLSFLAGLDHLQRLQLYDVDLPNTNFLSGFSDKRNFILEFSGDIRDYSGLRYVKDYDYLHVNPHNGNLDAVLPYLEELEEIGFVSPEGVCAFTLDDIPQLDRIREAAPELRLHVSFDLFGQTVSDEDERIEYYLVPIGNEGAETVRAVLPYLRSCSYFLLDGCDIDNEILAQLRDDFPDTKIVWRVWIIEPWYSSRVMMRRGSFLTDTERIRTTLVRPENCDVLKYCTETKYVDFGHNFQMSDYYFLAYMPKLEACIIAISHVDDLTPLASCPELEFLEVFTTDITDLSPLTNCKKLAYLNISNCKQLTDITPLYEMTSLKVLRMTATLKVPREQKEELARRLPDLTILNVGADPTEGGWRTMPRYFLLREQMKYDEDWLLYGIP